ncbi:MAG TPA: FAD-dependent oxidoreductase, partial [Streptomyces sp.]|nr:FAD-dependent oxidoreductase [Streptomyces sp.]
MRSESNSDVIVVGGGVVGLTTAVVLAEGGGRVRIWTREPSELTTSAVAGGLWWPYRIEPEELVGEWALATLAVYEELTARSDETGVRMVEGVHGETELDGLGAWASRVAGLRVATAGEYPGAGLWARLPLIDMPVHLRWLRERFTAAGGVVEERTVTDLAAVGAPVVVNCTGLGARELVPDPSVRPVRGQLVVVENPGVTTWLTSVDHSGAESTYFMPQPGGLILGGTAEEDAWSLTPD